MWWIFFPIEEEENVDEPEPVVQPTYRHMKIRSCMLRQIKNSHLKLRKTFIVESYGRTIIRGCSM